MADSDPRLNLYQRVRHGDAPVGAPADTRRWWEKQRFIIPILVAVLALPIWYVAGLMIDNANLQAQVPGDQTAADMSEAGDDGTTPADVEPDAGAEPRATSDGVQIAAPDPVPEVGSAATRDDSGTDGSASGANDASSARGAQATDAQDAAAAVCARVLGLRDDLQVRGVDVLAVYGEMLDIQQQAEGTALEDEVDAAVQAMDGFASGTNDSAAVASAGSALIAAC